MLRSRLGNYKRRFLNLVEKPATVLLYHRVTKLNSDPQLLSVTPENFYSHVRLLKKKFNLLRIDEFSDILIKKKKLPTNSVILTFDDGYADNFLEALPILQSLQTQALFYITTSNLGTTKELWWDELERILFKNEKLPPHIELRYNNSLLRYPLRNAEESRKVYEELHPLLKYSSPVQRNLLINQLQELTISGNSGRPTHRLLTEPELKALSSSPVAVIGAHTHNHPALSVLSYKEQFEEIKISKQILERIVNLKVEHFSYPYGGKMDYNIDSINACRELEFKMVCSNHYGQVHSWTNHYKIPRILVRNWAEKVFEQQVVKFFKS